MKISARIQNSKGNHQVILSSDANVHSINIPPKPTGFGSSANRAKVATRASEEEIRQLMQVTDQVAEIQNTLRVEAPVLLSRIEAVSV
jgi:hypothetical protein